VKEKRLETGGAYEAGEKNPGERRHIREKAFSQQTRGFCRYSERKRGEEKQKLQLKSTLTHQGIKEREYIIRGQGRKRIKDVQTSANPFLGRSRKEGAVLEEGMKSRRKKGAF